MNKILMALSLSFALLTPVCLSAQDHGDREQHDQQQRYYDKKHKDYHEWNGNEDQAWHAYWQQQHRESIDWSRANERQRQAYWNWRHQHSDALLQINIR